MAKLIYSFKKIIEDCFEPIWPWHTRYVVDICDSETNLPVKRKFDNDDDDDDDDDDTPHTSFAVDFNQYEDENLYSCLALYNDGDDSKLIFQYKMRYGDDYDYKSLYPYKKQKGEFVNTIPLDQIIKDCESIQVYTAQGRFVTRLYKEDEEVNDYGWTSFQNKFDIKFNKNTFTIVNIRKPISGFDLGNNSKTDFFYEVSKKIYNYNGDILFEKTNKIDFESVLTTNLNEEETLQ